MIPLLVQFRNARESAAKSTSVVRAQNPALIQLFGFLTGSGGGGTSLLTVCAPYFRADAVLTDEERREFERRALALPDSMTNNAWTTENTFFKTVAARRGAVTEFDVVNMLGHAMSQLLFDTDDKNETPAARIEKHSAMAAMLQFLALAEVRFIQEREAAEVARLAALVAVEVPATNARVEALDKELAMLSEDAGVVEQRLREVEDQSTGLEFGLDDYVADAMAAATEDRIALEAAVKAETHQLVYAQRNETALEAEKRKRLFARQTDAMDERLEGYLVKYNQMVVDKQSAVIGHMRSLYVMSSDRLSESMMAKLRLDDAPAAGSDVWTREAEGLASFLQGEVLATTTMLAEAPVDLGGAVERAHAELTRTTAETVRALGAAVDRMLEAADPKTPRAFPGPRVEQTCHPFGVAGGVLRCWDGATRKRRLELAFAAPDAPRYLRIACCKPHKEELERVREVQVTAYSMTAYGDERMWLMTVHNGLDGATL